MQIGDIALFYSSSQNKSVYGLMEVSSLPYNDPSSQDERWLSIDFKPLKTFVTPITYEMLKTIFNDEPFIIQPRLSVSCIKNHERVHELI